LIVTCGRCATRFQLEDERVPERGARVRCSRCKHAFHIARPGTAAADPVQRLARAAIEGGRSLDITQDLPPQTERPGDTIPDLEDPLAGPGAPAIDEMEESDWQFNDEDPSFDPDPEPADAGLAAAREAVDDLLGGSLPGEAEAAPDPDEFAAGAEPPPAGQQPEPAVDAFEAGPEAEDDAGDLGNPDTWDFFTEDPDDDPPPDQRSGRGGVRDDTDGQDEPRRRLAGRQPSQIDDDVAAAPRWIARLGHAVGWAATASLVAGALYAGLVPADRPAAWRPAVLPVAGFEAHGVEARWLDNLVVGPVYVVSGELRNPGSRAIAAGAPLALQLLDATGQPIPGAAAALGPAQSERHLRELAPEELAERIESGAQWLAHIPIGPGSRRGFQAVIADLPELAARYRFEARPDWLAPP
jgi:predicted Zn finger-like uncharacterized protein